MNAEGHIPNKNIEWEYSRNQRRHTFVWLEKTLDLVFEYQIKATNQELNINFSKDGYDLYLYKVDTCALLFIKHGKTVKELKQHVVAILTRKEAKK